MTQMSDEEIKAHAETRANSVAANDPPNEDDFRIAEEEIREFLEAGATYSQERGWEWPEVEEEDDWHTQARRVQFNIIINMAEVETLAEAFDLAALNIARYGLDTFHILATDLDTDKQWVIFAGNIVSSDDIEAERQLNQADGVDDDV